MLQVFEGEGKTGCRCHFLGRITLKCKPRSAIVMFFEVDTDGVLEVRAMLAADEKKVARPTSTIKGLPAESKKCVTA